MSHDSSQLLDDILGRLRNVKRHSNGIHRASCPAHDDDDPSLSLSIGDEGQVLVYCHAGCELSDICSELEIDIKDLWPEQQKNILEIPSKPPRRLINEKKYPLREISGKLIAYHVRREFSDGKKEFPWELPDGRFGLQGKSTKEFPLYNGHNIKWSIGAEVMIVEGEKACDALSSRGVNAVATVTGTSASPNIDQLVPYQIFSPIYLWADHDDVGLEHMRQVARSLYSIGAQNIYIIDWSGAGIGGDAFDFFEKGYSAADLVFLKQEAVKWVGSSTLEEEPDYVDLSKIRINGVTIRVENISDSVRSGVEATLVAHYDGNAFPPIFAHRVKLDSARDRDFFAENVSELSADDLLRVRHAILSEHRGVGEFDRYRTSMEIMDDFYNTIGPGHTRMVTTGFPLIDNEIGGYQPSKLVYWAGRTGSGKSWSLIRGLYAPAVQYGTPVGILSLEMREQDIVDRMIMMATEINMFRFRLSRHRYEDEEKRVAEVREKLKMTPFAIDDSSTGELHDVVRRIRLMVHETGAQVVFVDYIQKITFGSTENRHQDLATISNRLQRLAHELDVCIVVGSQLSRGVDARNNKKPQLYDMAESSSLEKDADIVLLIDHPHDWNPDEWAEDILNVEIAKNRGGWEGDLQFRRHHDFKMILP